MRNSNLKFFKCKDFTLDIIVLGIMINLKSIGNAELTAIHYRQTQIEETLNYTKDNHVHNIWKSNQNKLLSVSEPK